MVEELDFDVEIGSAGIGDGGDEDFDEEYEDLYDDVNVGFFPQEAAAPPARPAPSPVAAAPGKGSGELYPRDEQDSTTAPARVNAAPESFSKDEDPPIATGESAAPAAPIDSSPGILARPPPQQQQFVDANAKAGIFISELHWWTTDADLEAALADFGRHKGLKFSEERASGKSKGYCQVEFYDPLAAQQCKEQLNGRIFNGRPCVVQYATPQVLKQVNAKSQSQSQPSQAAQAPQQGQAGKKNSGGGMGLFGDPGFVPPMRPGIFGMGFMPRGPAYPMHYPGVPPPHVNPAFFGRGGANGHAIANAGGWSSGGWEESERGGGGGYGFEDEDGRGSGKETGKASRDHKDGKDLDREKERQQHRDSRDRDHNANKPSSHSYKSREKGEDYSDEYSKRRRH
ncbi:cleavage and polyadenylation specificity factor subunit 6-like [Selaginella moellendorffii]|uniref:cleavage and polyadenylation specificity factor subunit 6-like n=1 Tax=Selaginella moellendorffii TaxID=88036 RepID=UPI000D1CD65B|nr:cleavage and polyadenylation specificity factor subunit 6-like [Selaginella moellendorffii]|eukprot:XP_024527908.1 cleavage and polyadenylation specificity factor subunit 6-like [Selaginella moellendorffii]